MDITSIFSVFLAGLVELWLAIPLGFLLKLSPLITAITSAVGSIVAAVMVAFAGEDLRNRFLKWRYGGELTNKSRIYKIWNRYGVIGLGLLSPLLFGSLVGTALGIILGAPRNRLILWMAIGIIIWSSGLTAALYLGLITIHMNI
jgi:Putative small multi-drug export protein